jgi:hypothetical protein
VSRPRFLADHDLNELILRGVLFKEPSVGWVRAREVGLATASDPEMLTYAVEHGLIVVSHDVSTMTASAYEKIANGDNMAGLILVHQWLPWAKAIEDIVLIWSASEAEEWSNQVRFLPL